MATKRRGAQGTGNIRQRPDGRWEARYTYQDEFGATKRGSVYGATQRECRQKLTAILKAVDEGSYRKEPRITVEQWMNEWLRTYCTQLRESTVVDYQGKIARHIIPRIGSVYLSALTPMQVQRFVNALSDSGLSAKTVKNIHGILHSALKQAVLSGIIRQNPADNAKLPKVTKPELKPLMDDDISRFLSAIRGDRFERLYILDLFTGLRQSELLGLRWQDVDLEGGELHICCQLQKSRERGVGYLFVDSTKNGKPRTVPISPTLVELLRAQRREQAAWRLAAGSAWQNERDLVFTDELGGHLKHNTVFVHYKKIVRSLGLDARFHDLRHSCAILELQSGVSVKTVQEQLGHYSSSFTLDVYADVSKSMWDDAREKVEAVIQAQAAGQKEA